MLKVDAIFNESHLIAQPFSQPALPLAKFKELLGTLLRLPATCMLLLLSIKSRIPLPSRSWASTFPSPVMHPREPATPASASPSRLEKLESILSAASIPAAPVHPAGWMGPMLT